MDKRPKQSWHLIAEDASTLATVDATLARHGDAAAYSLPSPPLGREGLVYAELDLKFRSAIDRGIAVTAIRNNVGLNEIAVAEALAGTALSNVRGIVEAAMAAEQVLNAATVVYFMEGNDTIKAHIVVRSLSEVRKQCSRITRQLSEKLAGLAEANATVLVQVRGTDEAVLAGKKVGLAARLWAAISERALGKFVPAAVAFVVAAMALPGTTVFQSASIGLIAAGIGTLAEAVLAASSSDEWAWKDLP